MSQQYTKGVPTDSDPLLAADSDLYIPTQAAVKTYVDQKLLDFEAYLSLLNVIPFTPVYLFAAGEQGVWYDPSDFSTMFQDSAGTTPVTAVGDPVGLILDKSGNGNHAIQSTTTSRPILRQDASNKYYLEFDGTDDWLQISDINFSAKDEMSVFAGVRKLSDAASGLVAEIGTGTSNSAFTLLAPSANGGNSYRYTSVGTLIATTGTGVFAAAPDTAVITGISDISTPVATLRRNGVVVATSAASQGTGNFGNYPLYVGRRAGTTLPFNGRIYSLIVRGALTSSPWLEQAENWVNGKTGAY